MSHREQLLWDVIASTLSSGFGANFTVWTLPNIAFSLVDTNPELAFIYFEYALKNQEYGARWMLQSDAYMTMYRELSQIYSEEKTPEVWQRLQTLDTLTLINEIRTLAK
jgi:hypothetical protein